jgi:putative membrane protein
MAGEKVIWSYYLPLSGMLAQSGFFEIVEAIVAQIVSPELGAAYLGTQGDEWDAQKDMLAAGFGALLCMMAAIVAPTQSEKTASFSRHVGRGVESKRLN